MRFILKSVLCLSLLLATSSDEVQALAKRTKPKGRPSGVANRSRTTTQKQATASTANQGPRPSAPASRPPVPNPPAQPPRAVSSGPAAGTPRKTKTTKKIIKRTTKIVRRPVQPTHVIQQQPPQVIYADPDPVPQTVILQQPVMPAPTVVVAQPVMYNGHSIAVAAQPGFTMSPGTCKLPGGVSPGYFPYVRPDGLPLQSPAECEQACRLNPTCQAAHFLLASMACMLAHTPGQYFGDGQPYAYCYARAPVMPQQQVHLAPVYPPVIPVVPPVVHLPPAVQVHPTQVPPVQIPPQPIQPLPPVVVGQGAQVPVVAGMAGMTMSPGACKSLGGATPGPFSPALQINGLPPASALECQQLCFTDATCHSAHFWLPNVNTGNANRCLIQRSPGLYGGDGQPGAYCYAKTSMMPAPIHQQAIVAPGMANPQVPVVVQPVAAPVVVDPCSMPWHPPTMPIVNSRSARPVYYTDPASRREFTWYPAKQHMYTYKPENDSQYMYARDTCKETLVMKGYKAKMMIAIVAASCLIVCCILLVCFCNKDQMASGDEEVVEEVVIVEEVVEEQEYEGGRANDRTDLLEYFKKQEKRRNSKNRGQPGHNYLINNSQHSGGHYSTDYSFQSYR